MCMGNPSKEQAKIRYAEKNYNYFSNSKKFFNKETTAIRNKSRAVTGLSRTWSDIDQKAFEIQKQGRRFKQSAQMQFAKKQFVDEGGRARTAGRSQYLQLLKAQSDVESKLNRTFTTDYARAQTASIRQYQKALASNRQELGIMPEWGAPVLYARQSLWEKMQPVLQIGMMFASWSGGGGLNIGI